MGSGSTGFDSPLEAQDARSTKAAKDAMKKRTETS
jgi:hypothetical protein